MNKSLNPGILFILTIALLCIGGTVKGAIGAGLAAGGLICFLAAIISGVKSIINRGKKGRAIIPTDISTVESKTAISKKYTRLETKRGWRIAKVIYWIAIVFAIVFSLFNQDYYGNYDMQGFAFFLVLICFPLYLLYRKVAQYIVSGA